MIAEQSKIIVDIDNLKNKILNSTDKSEIISYLLQVIHLAIEVSPKISGPLANYKNYYQESRQRAINMLRLDLKAIEDGSYYNFELIHFQTACSILMLLLTMVDGGVSEIDSIINGLS
ncbi:MAG: hypothetical protein M0Q26_05705 [Chitinophagaceae bacterium]|nr:hypothetical protein [Chitinophagaceae bacterium]